MVLLYGNTLAIPSGNLPVLNNDGGEIKVGCNTIDKSVKAIEGEMAKLETIKELIEISKSPFMAIAQGI